jgi:hypothetical protein
MVWAHDAVGLFVFISDSEVPDAATFMTDSGNDEQLVWFVVYGLLASCL